ncbi:hypothetical protein TNCV_3346171 [Trichonephila clavipes]|nr:hypothetical protein TNCV_3346171 [Trichonephila clavipes]
MRWCVFMQKIPVVTLLELRSFTTNRFPQTTSSRSVYLQRFVPVFDDDLFEHIQTPTQHFPRSVKSVVQRVHRLRWIIALFKMSNHAKSAKLKVLPLAWCGSSERGCQLRCRTRYLTEAKKKKFLLLKVHRSLI